VLRFSQFLDFGFPFIFVPSILSKTVESGALASVSFDRPTETRVKSYLSYKVEMKFLKLQCRFFQALESASWTSYLFPQGLVKLIYEGSEKGRNRSWHTCSRDPISISFIPYTMHLFFSGQLQIYRVRLKGAYIGSVPPREHSSHPGLQCLQARRPWSSIYLFFQLVQPLTTR